VLIERQTPWPLIVQDLEDVVVVGLEIFVAYRLHSLELVECEGTESQEWQMASRRTDSSHPGSFGCWRGNDRAQERMGVRRGQTKWLT